MTSIGRWNGSIAHSKIADGSTISPSIPCLTISGKTPGSRNCSPRFTTKFNIYNRYRSKEILRKICDLPKDLRQPFLQESSSSVALEDRAKRNAREKSYGDSVTHASRVLAERYQGTCKQCDV